MMPLFLDTEYTGLGQAVPGLISLAIVPEDGKKPFYAEISMGWLGYTMTTRRITPSLTLGASCRVVRLGWMPTSKKKRSDETAESKRP